MIFSFSQMLLVRSFSVYPFVSPVYRDRTLLHTRLQMLGTTKSAIRALVLVTAASAISICQLERRRRFEVESDQSINSDTLIDSGKSTHIDQLLKSVKNVLRMTEGIEFAISALKFAFPIDLVLSYNDSAGNIRLFLARYASFSPILNVLLRSQYMILNTTACERLDPREFPGSRSKVLIVQRGTCTFADKVRTLLESHLDPHAIIIANNESNRGLVTMYSKNLIDDDLVTVPTLFTTLEGFEDLKEIQHLGRYLVLQTVSTNGLVGVMLLMVASPIILILFCYLLVKFLKHFRRRTLKAHYKKFVEKMPVYIYYTDHLIPSVKFYPYLVATEQTADFPLVPSSSDDLLGYQEPDQRPLGYSMINNVDLRSIADIEILFVDKDYFRTQKCSICLGRFHPLKSEVLVLKCKHVYHKSCLSNWLVNFRRSCPLCNKNLNLLEQSMEPRPI